jgi:hypothetical protein
MTCTCSVSVIDDRCLQGSHDCPKCEVRLCDGACTADDLVRARCARAVRACGIKFDYLESHLYRSAVESLVIHFTDDVSFDMLERLSKAFGTRLINLGADEGIGTGCSFERYITVDKPVVPKEGPA